MSARPLKPLRQRLTRDLVRRWMRRGDEDRVRHFGGRHLLLWRDYIRITITMTPRGDLPTREDFEGGSILHAGPTPYTDDGITVLKRSFEGAMRAR